ncbi:MAG: ribonuclease III [Planctomycetes bacterium]|nr:ribonuclease III [Planctomycetota bacterium]
MNLIQETDTLDPLSASLARCERRIGYVFHSKDQLREALTHASGAVHRLASNERMEFLGDAILGKVVCKHLFLKYPQYLEGDLTKIKSIVVSRQTCAKISQRLRLQEFLIVGKGMASCPTTPPSLLADVFESLIAAIELDGGPEEAERFIHRHVIPEIELAVAGEIEGNYKSLLQQYAQRVMSATPAYQLLQEKGPDHSKTFKVAAEIGGELYPPAWGRNKKEAEQRAARNALSELRAIDGFPAEDGSPIDAVNDASAVIQREGATDRRESLDDTAEGPLDAYIVEEQRGDGNASREMADR